MSHQMANSVLETLKRLEAYRQQKKGYTTQLYQGTVSTKNILDSLMDDMRNGRIGEK